MKITSKKEFINYCKRALGFPANVMTLDDDQLYDRVDDAIHYYQEFHSDGNTRTYLKHQVVGSEIKFTTPYTWSGYEIFTMPNGKDTIDAQVSVPNGFQTKNSNNLQVNDVVTSQTTGISYTVQSVTIGDFERRYVEVGDFVISVTKVIPYTNPNITGYNIFDPRYSIILNDMRNITNTDLVYFEQMMSHIEIINQIIRPLESCRYTKHQNKIYIDTNWSGFTIGQYIVFDAYVIIDPDQYVEMYNDRLLKALAIAYIKKQMAINLKQFDGVQMIGGVTVNGTALYQEAMSEIEDIQNDIRENHETPAIGFFG